MESLKYNLSIPEYIKKESSLETCFNLIRLQNNIKTIDIVKNSINARSLFMSLDTESYEKNHDYLTEVGWVIFDKTERIIKKKHYIIQEYLCFHNGKYVEDNKHNYNFGESETKSLNEVKRILNSDLNSVNYIVGQGINNDIRDLNNRGINLLKFKEMKGNYKEYGIIDTQDLFAGYFHESPISLKRGLDKFSIPYRNLHNAGNDAYYTMKYFFKLIENFNINQTKNQTILNIIIIYSRNNSYNNNSFNDDCNNYDSCDDYYDYEPFESDDNYFDDTYLGIGGMLGIDDSDELDEYIAKYGFY